MEHDNKPDPNLWWSQVKLKFYKPPVDATPEELAYIKSIAQDPEVKGYKCMN